ncbi:MAG: hypothetical protein K6F33_09365 [Bacteroidales bacterium]|nr:hypothetical protein [Bacteroidales bacterium]
MDNFEQQLSQERKTHWIWLIAISAALIVVWFVRNINPSNALIDNPYIVMALEYVCMLGSGFAIWYGYHTYTKTARILKPKDDLDEKQQYFINTKRFQNKLIYIAYIVNVLALAITFKEQCAFVSVITAIFCAMGFPTLDRFENDFIEPEYDDEQFEPEFNKQHQNDIKERFEEERGVIKE